MSIKQYSLANTFMLSSLLLAGISSQIVTSLSIDSKVECYKNQRDGSWKYLEYLFVVQPVNELKQASNQAQVLMAVSGALFLARTSIYNIVNPQKKLTVIEAAVVKDKPTLESIAADIKELQKTNKGKEAAFDLAGHLAGLVISGVAYQTYCSYLESNIRKNTMIKFLQNWSIHRSHVPDEFAASFDELAQYYQENSLTNEQISELFEVIQHLIEHSFEKRYPKAKDLDLLGTFKTFTDIGKNLKG